MKAAAIAAAMLVAAATAAFADYYVVKDVGSQKCSVVSDCPIDTSQVLLGIYETFAEALRALATVCEQKG